MIGMRAGIFILLVLCVASAANAGSRLQSRSNSVFQANCARMHFKSYHRSYHDAAVYKIFLKRKSDACPLTTLDQVMETVRAFHDISGGIPQVVYLVGWQADGHDSKYPDWSHVGVHCRSSYSDDPVQSLRKIMTEAHTYNAAISLHVNMNDAYTNSPLWQTYLDGDVLCRQKDGSFLPTGVWDGEASYGISHVKEWRSGLAQKRILSLLALLPELKESKTIHIDALYGLPSERDGLTAEADKIGINEIVDFWHEQGLDVTTEFLPSFDQIGYFPMVYHINTDERHRLLYPPKLLCGGDADWNTRNSVDYYVSSWGANMPAGGCVYEEAWGEGHWGDLTGPCVQDMRGFLNRFFNHTALFVYYNRSRPVRHVVDEKYYTVTRANGVEACVRMSDRALVVTDRGRKVVSQGDFFLDYPHGGGIILAYSTNGCNREFELPLGWESSEQLVGTQYPSRQMRTYSIVGKKIFLRLAAGTSVVLKKL